LERLVKSLLACCQLCVDISAGAGLGAQLTAGVLDQGPD
jgi:hypothetical protein